MLDGESNDCAVSMNGQGGDARSRTLERVYFYTSSMDKFLQARRVFDKHGLIVDYYKSKTEPYDEDYGGSSEDLLRKALSDVTSQIGRAQLLFIEDTSVRIEALSLPGGDYPGLDVKDWFARTSFDECDTAIKEAGGNRDAVVKSDIALSVPGLDRPVFFHGETAGRIAEKAPEFEQNLQSPWLTPDTFNGWFVPDGHDLPLGALPPSVAEPVDFRARCFESMIGRIDEYMAVLNLPSTAYRVRKPIHKSTQPSLFPEGSSEAPALLVIGRTCAGKTTMADYLSGYCGFRMIEASTIVRSLPVNSDRSDDLGGHAFAERALSELGNDIVAVDILRRFGSDLDAAFVVSGLRDPGEILTMRASLPRCVVILVEASERVRFDRHVRRGRAGAEQDLRAFRKRDLKQNVFGLLSVAEDVADFRLSNEGTMLDFQNQIRSLVDSLGSVDNVRLSLPRHGPDENQLFRCLSFLRAEGGPLQCDEIEERSVAEGLSRIRHNNANKVLRAVPALAERIDPGEGSDSARLRYALSARGADYLSLMERRPGYLSGESG